MSWYDPKKDKPFSQAIHLKIPLLSRAFVRAYYGGWPCSNWARFISRPCSRISALNVTSRDVIWQPCARGLILIDSLIWLGDPSPPRCGRDSSDLTRWRAAGLTVASFCLRDCSHTHVDHVIQCLISLSVNSIRTLDSFESCPKKPYISCVLSL